MSSLPRPTLGEAIRQRRLELGLTQEELAERIGDGVGQNYVSQLERDKVKLPRAERLARIADVLGLKLGDLLARSGWVGFEHPIEATLIGESGGQAKELSRNIRDEQRQAAEGYAKAVAEQAGPDYDALSDPALAKLFDAMETLSEDSREDLMAFVDLLLARELRRRGRGTMRGERLKG